MGDARRTPFRPPPETAIVPDMGQTVSATPTLKNRAPHSGGLWSHSCCGHPRPGEANDVGAARRLREELDIDIPLTRIGAVSYEATFDSGPSENEVLSAYAARSDGRIRPGPA